MRRVAVVVLLSIATVFAVDKSGSSQKKASDYPDHQTAEKISVAAIPYVSSEQAATVFGKARPYQEGIMPILVVVENGTDKALRLDLTAELVTPDNDHLKSLSPDQVKAFHASPKNPVPRTTPLPIGKPKKPPLNTPEIDGKAFAVHLVPPGESVSGFFYFESDYEPGQKVYLNGFKDAASGKDYFYFEVPLEKVTGR